MMKGDKIEPHDQNGGTATIANVKQSNGMIHMIDHVPLPNSNKDDDEGQCQSR